jgi:hypothetical protein
MVIEVGEKEGVMNFHYWFKCSRDIDCMVRARMRTSKRTMIFQREKRQRFSQLQVLSVRLCA